jgi:uncharacterized protein (DUF1684 family)
MMNRSARQNALILAFFIARVAFPLSAQSVPETQHAATDDAQWRQELATWRAEREHEIAAPDGWLTLVGLEWLKPGVNSVGAAKDNKIRVRTQAPDHIGLFTVNGKSLQLLAPASGFPPDLTIDGSPAREGIITTDDSRLTTIVWHGLNLAVLHRGDRYALRIKDADSPARAAFHGLNWYPPDPHFHVVAQWVPFPSPQIEKIPIVTGTTLDLPAPGVAQFTLDGKSLRLEPVIEAGQEGTLFFILRDVTSRSTTYATARYLHTGLPDHGLDQPGLLTLDFNRLENPPCAYTTYATCPLPPAQNQLPVALQAGEELYPH